MLSWWLNEIAVIGTGNIGGMLARKLSAAGHDLRIANSRGLEDIRAFANEIEATAADTRGDVQGRSRERLPTVVVNDEETTRKGLAAAVRGKAPKKLERLIDLYRQRGANITHADIVGMNRSLNPLD